MSKTSGRTRWLYTVLIAAAVGCSSSDNRTNRAPSGHVVATARQAVTTANGYAENGLWANGLWANGLWANGLWANGLWANGLWANGLWANGLWANGLWANGLWANGLWANGLWANGLWANGLTGEAAIPGDTLRSSQYARALLQYIYACAMPAVTYDTAIDPGAGSCTPGGDATVECGAAYACSPTGTCVVPLTGAIGLGINTDGSAWWESGTCDESCQRWVSACVLARTNAYGVHVQISMRAPTVVPAGRAAQFNRIQTALLTSAAEAAEYSQPEGAYFGNLFATTPVNPPPLSGNGPTDGPIANSPVFYACAGPASNIPDLTKRFCSSQGDATVISVPGVCITGTTSSGVTEAGTCNGTDPYQPKHDCYTTPSATSRPACADPHDPTCYQEVISVFLKIPVAVCGNDICETSETETTCPTDCHPGTWAHSYDKTLSEQNFTGSSTTVTAVGNPDQSIVMAGLALQPVDFGGGDLVGDGALGLVKFSADGTYLWGRREIPSLSPSVTHAVAVGGDGSIVVSGLATIPGAVPRIWLDKFDANGEPVPGWPITINGEPGITNGTRLAIDHQGNILVSASAPPQLPNTNSNYMYGDAYVYKVSAEGQVLWAAGLGPSYGGYVNPIAADANNDGLVTILSPNTDFVPANVRLLKLASATGAIVWDSRVTNARAGAAADQGMFCALAVDAAGDTYVMNSAFNSALDGGLEKFAAADGQRLFADAMSIYHPGAVCYGGHDFLSLGPDGSVVAGIVFGGFYRTVADLGAGEFDSYSTADVAIAAYAPDTTIAPGKQRFRWAKHMPMILQSQFNGMGVDTAGRVVVTGSYSGSMLVDGRLLINSVPELTGNANAYLASFGGPSLTDTTAPIIGMATDPSGGTINTVPTHIYTPATSARGATVFYLPPTAVDEGHAGANVSCAPRPNTVFPIGTTIVTCTATDPLGNHSTATFPVTVVDSYGPAFAPVTNPPPVQAPTTAGATVTFATPTATDQIDGPRPVTCSPPSGSLFEVGDTTVTCSATDLSNHTSRTTLKVTVTPPLLGSGCSTSADCASGSCVDGVCCNTSSCGACHACNVPGSVGTCAPTSGGSCSDGNACTGGDVCRVGVCVAGAPVTCNDGNVCTVDACNPSTGCTYVPGNAGTVCRGAANICDTAETCTGQSASCPVSTDARAPKLGAGSNQTVVGTCSSAPIAFTLPTVANASCETGTTVACTQVAGNSYGAHLITCKARDAAGNVSPPVTFTVTVLRPLSVRVQPPLTGNGATNVVKRNSTVPNKVLLFACDTNVTESAPVTVKLGVKFFRGNGTPGTPVSVNCDGVGDAGGVMKLEGKMYRYDLSTKGFNITNSDPSYYEEAITVTYRSTPAVTVGSDTVRLEVK